jgi:hypothetical protein
MVRLALTIAIEARLGADVALSNPQTWIGALCGAALIGIAIHLRIGRAEA